MLFTEKYRNPQGQISGADHKLTWKSHIEDIANLAMKTPSPLKRLAGARWSCTGPTLLQTYHAFIRPLLTYCCKSLVVAIVKSTRFSGESLK
ncbi:hypothetical protein CEXT_427531 [Caerostris extrusa]|uniref:Uncharacterized protein n=1 Tax=Caerostris extrusa TaxID=172846 RepID=A0AAV4PZ02_CAEEX|nr:hypothetical protein CEXT_427531 [Caerostris extrusa]